ncbi:hypothetical protein ACIBI8_28080 [Streptomyces sp. NPDC050529]|uniref:hypothetical protein n=1 Tax=unclassified Streptomyces TaxID=2593676 RepID=UPI002DDBBD22|nr:MULTISPECIES: hypothetical protein [unclassified Streptomyces]WRZ84451.1 hypothetical protein OG316_31425 [Streptomyces sp. NBC_01022]
MFKNAFTRTLLAGAGAATLVLGVSGTASAADSTLWWSIPNDAARGYMKHIDDGDTFKICDTLADGYGMTGILEEYTGGKWVERGRQDDGGDSGCDSFGYNVLTGHKYQMILWWNADPSGVVKSISE